MPNPSVHMKGNQKVTVNAAPKAADGQVGTLTAGNVPTWTSTAPSIATVTASPDGLSGVVTATGIVGTVSINVSGNSIPFGPNFTSVFDVVIDPSGADHFDFSFGTPVNQ